ncbi:MAG TPA: hypothetical protein VKV28_11725 [Candidatus Binataceae bacterium]|nr:hypothetical protein [Candidatus Binataceae bacterium]
MKRLLAIAAACAFLTALATPMLAQEGSTAGSGTMSAPTTTKAKTKKTKHHHVVKRKHRKSSKTGSGSASKAS